jgi:hypothetical protein
METKVTLHRGRIAKPPRILAVRALTREDLGRLGSGERRVVPRVQQYRDTHHRLARMIAAGMSNEEVMRITGYSYTRLCTLKADPAFAELIAQNREKITENFVDEVAEAQQTAAELIIRGLRQVEEHFDRADEANELIPLQTLVKVNGDLMDRFGYSKKTVNVNVNAGMAKQMEKTMAKTGRGAVIDAPALAPPSPTEPVTVSGFRRRA